MASVEPGPIPVVGRRGFVALREKLAEATGPRRHDQATALDPDIDPGTDTEIQEIEKSPGAREHLAKTDALVIWEYNYRRPADNLRTPEPVANGGGKLGAVDR